MVIPKELYVYRILSVKILTRTLAVATAVITSGIITSPVLASAAVAMQTNSGTISTGTVRSALNQAGTLGTSAAVVQKEDTKTNLKVATSGGELSLPKDAKAGVSLASLGIKVSLPNADKADTGTTVAPGVVAYGGTNGSANAVQANADGSVRMLSVISKASAPTDYSYELDLPDGATLRAEATGGVSILDSKGQILATIDAPWAKDANGKVIQTSYNVTNDMITQHVAHNVKGVAYPVTADPMYRKWWGYQVQLNKSQTNNLMAAYIFAGILGTWIPNALAQKIAQTGYGAAAGYAGWASARGACLEVNITYTGGYWLNHYYGGNCR